MRWVRQGLAWVMWGSISVWAGENGGWMGAPYGIRDVLESAVYPIGVNISYVRGRPKWATFEDFAQSYAQYIGAEWTGWRGKGGVSVSVNAVAPLGGSGLGMGSFTEYVRVGAFGKVTYGEGKAFRAFHLVDNYYTLGIGVGILRPYWMALLASGMTYAKGWFWTYFQYADGTVDFSRYRPVNGTFEVFRVEFPVRFHFEVGAPELRFTFTWQYRSRAANLGGFLSEGNDVLALAWPYTTVERLGMPRNFPQWWNDPTSVSVDDGYVEPDIRRHMWGVGLSVGIRPVKKGK